MPASSFDSYADSPTAPARACFAVVPHDTQDLPNVTKALFIGEGGDVVLVPASGGAGVTFRNLASGSILDVQVRAVRATGTSAGAIVGLH